MILIKSTVNAGNSTHTHTTEKKQNVEIGKNLVGVHKNKKAFREIDRCSKQTLLQHCLAL